MKDSKRFKVFICNIIISVLCLFSIVSYFIWPFFKLEVSLTVTPEILDTVLASMGGEGGDPNAPTAAEGESGDDAMGNMFANIDTEAFCADLDPITLSIELKTADIMASLNSDATASVQTIIDSNVNNIIDELDEPLNKVAKGAVKEVSKVVVKETLKETVKESIKGSLEETLTDSEVDTKVNEVLQEVGITDEYISEKIDTLLEDLSGEAVPVAEATDKIVNTIDSVITDLKTNAENSTSNNPLLEDLNEIELTDDFKAELKEGMGEMIGMFADENGNVNIDTLLPELLLQLMQSAGGEGEGNGSEGGMEEGGISVKVSTLSASYTSSEVSSSEGLTGDEQDAKEQLKAELRQIINDAIPDDLAEIIASAMQIISYVIYFTFFTWAWLILKILVKCRRHCNGIKLKLPIWLGWLPYLILGLIPNFVVSKLKDPAFIAEMGMGEIGGIMSAININFFNCGFISFYIAIFLLLFGLFYYGPLRRKLKKEAKRMKKEAKRAKKEAKKAAKLGGSAE